MSKSIALFCKIYPASELSQAQILTLLDTGKSYYTSPESRCTAWTYFLPVARPRLPAALQRPEKTEVSTSVVTGSKLVVAGMEIYTDKTGISRQLAEPSFQEYHETVKNGGWYARDEVLVAWYPTAGFVTQSLSSDQPGSGPMSDSSRSTSREGSPKAYVVVAVVSAKPGKRDELVREWSKFADWCRQNEPDTLTYSIMTRPKAPDEVLVWERYTTVEAFDRHRFSDAIKANFEAVKRLMQPRAQFAGEWMELGNGFVKDTLGRRNGNPALKL